MWIGLPPLLYEQSRKERGMSPAGEHGFRAPNAVTAPFWRVFLERMRSPERVRPGHEKPLPSGLMTIKDRPYYGNRGISVRVGRGERKYSTYEACSDNYYLMWLYRSTCGLFTIKVEPDGRYGLWLEEELLGTYETAALAADDVYTQSTGAYEWDDQEPVEEPSDLSKWDDA